MPARALLIVALAQVLQAPAQRQEDGLARAVDALGQEVLQLGANGMAVVVDVEGTTLLARGWGFNDSHRDQRAEAEAIFRVGALLPSFLAVSALELAEREVLDLDAPLSAYLPDLPYGELGVTVDQLLTHTSGIPSYAELVGSSGDSGHTFEAEPILAWLASGPLEAPPGSCASYSPTNDLLLGLVLESLTEKSVAALLQETVFLRAGMEDTSWCFGHPRLRVNAGRAQEFAGAMEDQGVIPSPFDAEGLCSSARDLVRFQRALVGGKLLRESSLRLRTSETTLTGGAKAAHGRGVSLTRLGDALCHVAGGRMAGYGVTLSYFPDMDATIALVVSGEDVPLQRIGARAARALLLIEQPETRDIPLAPAERARRTGDFYAGCTSYGVAEEGEHLVLFPPAGARHVLLFQGGESFVAADDPDVRLTFELEGERVVSFWLEEHGVGLRAKRVH